jgi:ankyrin repeat protein
MAKSKIGFKLRKVLGFGSAEPEQAAKPASESTGKPDSGPDIIGPLFVRYAVGGMIRTFGQTPNLRDLTTLDGDVIRPRTYLEVPIAGDVDASEIQVLLDDLHGSKDEILDALEQASACREWSGKTPAEIKDMLSAALDGLVAQGKCRIIEALITTPEAALIRVDADEGGDIDGLFGAAARGDIQAVTAALDAGTDPNVASDVQPLLHYAIALDDVSTIEGRLAVLRLLLDRGAAIDSPDGNGWTPLLTALQSGEERIVRLLLERGANANATDGKGWSAFHYLAANDSDAVLYRLLAEAGADPNVQSRAEGNTALMIAVDAGAAGAVQRLLECGASAAIARKDGLTALHMAVSKGEIAIARSLLEADADANARGIGNGGTALHVAAARGKLPMIDLLLEHRGDPSVVDDNGYTAIEIADGTGQFEAAERLAAGSAQKDDTAQAPQTDAPDAASAAQVESTDGAAAGGGVPGASAGRLPRWDVPLDADPDPALEERVPMIRQQAPTIAQALDNLDDKLEQNPQDTQVLKSRGILLQQIGLTRQALSSFERIVVIDGGDADVFTYCGQMILQSALSFPSGGERTGLLDMAKGAFNTALNKDSGHVEAAIGMGTLYFVTSEQQQAMAFYDLALRNDATSGKAWHMKGLALQANGQTVEAAACFAKAAELGFEAQ